MNAVGLYHNAMRYHYFRSREKQLSAATMKTNDVGKRIERKSYRERLAIGDKTDINHSHGYFIQSYT